VSLNVQWGGPITNDHLLYGKLTDQEKKWLLPEDLFTSYNLPVLLMATGVNAVTETSIKDIVFRANIVYAHNIHNLLAWAGHKYCHTDHELERLLTKYIGVSTNTGYKQFRTWIKDHDYPATTAKDIKEVEREYQAWWRVYDSENKPEKVASKRKKPELVSGT
jgi:hypothetical protein